MTNLKEVKKEITRQTKGREMAMVFVSVPESHFATLMQRFGLLCLAHIYKQCTM